MAWVPSEQATSQKVSRDFSSEGWTIVHRKKSNLLRNVSLGSGSKPSNENRFISLALSGEETPGELSCPRGAPSPSTERSSGMDFSDGPSSAGKPAFISEGLVEAGVSSGEVSGVIVSGSDGLSVCENAFPATNLLACEVATTVGSLAGLPNTSVFAAEAADAGIKDVAVKDGEISEIGMEDIDSEDHDMVLAGRIGADSAVSEKDRAFSTLTVPSREDDIISNDIVDPVSGVMFDVAKTHLWQDRPLLALSVELGSASKNHL